MIRVERLTGAALLGALEEVARLRIAVFRDWPYLYDGDPAYEAAYLRTYRESAGAIVVGAFDGDRIVGAATGTPVEDHAENFAAALSGQAVPLQRMFYCAESILLPEYRGRGLGHAFFDAREAHARTLGRTHAAFCSVIRPADHPLRPEGHRLLDGFWRKRGYEPLPGAVAGYRWKDIDQPGATDHRLQVWMRRL